MLDNGTKRRIDNARQILVGKVPDPKAQVEQITTALIYKFMDDMDQTSIELGGIASFFVGEYKKYAWPKIMDKSYGGYERLALYSEAIMGMSQNPNLPPLFREIFKDAFLPYRDPETLNLFLKEIDGFTYDHSERLGDAFEYLLSVLGSQGDAGQFRTPRHIIDFIVEIVAPRKTDTVLDPACGTAGFLISAYKHILAKNIETRLSPDEKERLTKNFVGYDISPDMVRLSLVNMYLHKFQNPTIFEYDTLTSEDKWDDNFDVILANPPFMSPKGGIRPHARFSVQANRSEVLFVDYIAEHLTPNGRAGVIVPEGVIFRASNAYKKLRKMLVEENYLYAVVSLPAGVFKPYSGVKTSILLMDKALAKRTENILFVNIENDGFGLGDQRRPIEANDLPEALGIVKDFQTNPNAEPLYPHFANIVTKTKIAKDGDFNLSGGRYREVVDFSKVKWPLMELGDKNLFQIESGGTPSTKNEEYWNGEISWITLVDLPQENRLTYISGSQRNISQLGLDNSSAKLLPENSIVVSSRATIGRIGITHIPIATNQGFKNIVIRDFSRVNPHFLANILLSKVKEMERLGTGGTYKEISRKNFMTLKIPLPPLEVQQAIVGEIEGYQKVIDGARMVVDNYKPQIKVDPDWPMVELGKVIVLEYGKGLTKTNRKGGDYPVFGSNGLLGFHDNYLVEGPFIIIGRKGSAGAITYSETNGFPIDTTFYVNIIDPSNVALKYLYYQLRTMKLDKLNVQAGVPGLNRKDAYKLKIPLPPLEVQQAIVNEIDTEQKIIDANKQLIQLFEKKIEDKINEVWGA